MKHFNIGDKVKIVENQEKPWTYDWQYQEFYVVGIELPKSEFYPGDRVDEYNINYTIAEEYPCNKYGYTDGFKHGDLKLVT